MEYRIEEKGVVPCVCVIKNFGKITINKKAEHWTEEKPDIWKFWEASLDKGANVPIRDKYKLYREPFWQVDMDVVTENGDTIVYIGAEARKDEEYPE